LQFKDSEFTGRIANSQRKPGKASWRRWHFRVALKTEKDSAREATGGKASQA
jgi:hypothetical protein